MSHIQFKKLVWEQKDCDLFCKTPLAVFSICFHSVGIGGSYTNLFMLTIKAGGKKIKYSSRSAEQCRIYAQQWFEQQLTQFIETSENAAQ